MATSPFSVVSLNLGLNVLDLLQTTPPQSPLVMRQIQGLAYQVGLTCQYESYLQLSSNTLKSIFTGLQCPIVYVRNVSTSGLLNVQLGFQGTTGAIGVSNVDQAGSGYAVNDTGLVLAGNNDATYVIDSVGGFGTVLTYHLVTDGTGYVLSTNVPTAPGGSQPGTGSGFSIDITNVSVGLATVISLGPLGVFLYYQPNSNPGITNSVNSLSLASPQNQAVTLAEYLYAQ